MIPHDHDAEAAAIGGCLLAPEAREHALATLTVQSFHDVKHQAVWVALAFLAGSGSPIDVTTLAAEMARQKTLERAGGRGYLLQLFAEGSSLGVRAHIELVADRAARRQLIGLGEHLITRASDLQEDPAEIVSSLDREGERVRLPAEPIAPPMDLDAFLEIEDPPDDFVISKILARGDRIIWTSSEGAGKALAVDTPIPTPDGWRTMGTLVPGDRVFGPNGESTEVLAVTPPLEERSCFRVRFSDGSQIIADGAHRWRTETLKAREAAASALRRGPTKKHGADQSNRRVSFPEVVTTEEIKATLWARDGYARNHSIEVCVPLQYEEKQLAISPYVLGAWLGDGTSADAGFTCGDSEIIEHIRSTGWRVLPVPSNGPYGWRIMGPPKRRSASFTAALGALGVRGNKHIPEIYQRASVEQRLALLQGLMDTDGTVDTGGSGSGRGSGSAGCEFSVCSKQLATDVLELLLGLGIKTSMNEGPAKLYGRTVGTRYRMAFQTDLPVFHLKRKAERLTRLRTRRSKLRYITAVEPIPSVPVRCIRVAADDGMFLAGRECIPTHNSELQMQLAVCTASGVHPFFGYPTRKARVLIVDLENPDKQMRHRLRKFRALAGDRYQGGLAIESRREGLNLRDLRDFRWLDEKLERHHPELLVIGPLYKMFRARGGESKADETAAEECAYAIDRLIVRHNIAVSIEAHSPHGHQGDREGFRPIGASLWLRWPEFGIALKPVPGEGPMTVDLRHWRGARDRDRQWPRGLIQGHSQTWPWVALDEPRAA